MPNRRSARSIVLAVAALAMLAACGQPTPPIDPATLPQDFSFQVANPDEVSGAVFAPVYEAFGSFPGVMAASEVAPAQATAIRDAMDEATLTLAGLVSGTLTPVAELSRINEAIGFFIGGGEFFFVPEECDVTTENATEAAFATMFDLIVWDGSTLDANGLPAVWDAEIDLTVVDGDVQTDHLLVASMNAWSATTNGACAVDATMSYQLDLDVAVGWQFLRATFDSTVGDQSLTFETLSLEEVAAAGVIGVADIGGGGGIVLADEARRLTPIYR